ncbi:MAG: hypothetical protein JSV88_33565 [Candidatus Aminicenantes bacterium]|nr:MAG: hypothetical protein JSV88_33565 [Candidatus Aminicenantes bacterium]
MKSKTFDQALEKYLEEIFYIYHQKSRSCFLDYIPLLTRVILAAVKEFQPEQPGQQDNRKEKVLVESLDMELINNSKHSYGFPCIRVWDGVSKIYGYIEPFNPFSRNFGFNIHPLGQVYRQVFMNLISTNFFLFLHYRDKNKSFTRPFQASIAGELTKDFHEQVKNPADFLRLLESFLNYRPSYCKSVSMIELQQRLSIKSYFLRQYVLLPFFKQVLHTDIDEEPMSIYKNYCDFFHEELTGEEFCSFLTHVIIDGFLRTAVFYTGDESNEKQQVSPAKAYEYARFKNMPGRRLSVFKYLSSTGNQLPGSLQWMLDDICCLLCHFDFKKMGFSTTNPGIIKGEDLQWPGYFFSPYYDLEEQERIKELLQKEDMPDRDAHYIYIFQKLEGNNDSKKAFQV